MKCARLVDQRRQPSVPEIGYATGDGVVLRKFEEGTVVPAYIHPETNETACALEGQ